MIRFESHAAFIAVCVVLLITLVLAVGFLWAYGDRGGIESYGLRRGWTLKRVWWLPMFLLQGRHSDGRMRYRATFTTVEGKEERIWFESVPDGEPVPSNELSEKKKA